MFAHSRSPAQPAPRQPTALGRLLRGPIELTVEQLLLAASLFWLVSANRIFIARALEGHSAVEASTWGFALALAIILVALHFLLPALVANWSRIVMFDGPWPSR